MLDRSDVLVEVCVCVGYSSQLMGGAAGAVVGVATARACVDNGAWEDRRRAERSRPGLSRAVISVVVVMRLISRSSPAVSARRWS